MALRAGERGLAVVWGLVAEDPELLPAAAPCARVTFRRALRRLGSVSARRWSGAAAYGGPYFIVALATRNAPAPLALAPLLTPSSCPRTWSLARCFPAGSEQSAWNRFTYMIDAARPLTTVPFARAPVGKAVAVAVTLLVVTQLASLHAFARAVDAA